jgi:hypothetical protein
MKPTVIVWDLETVPDLSGFAAANDLVGKSDVEVARRSATNSQSTFTIRLSALGRSSHIASPITGQWMQWARRTWARGQRRS